MKKTLLTSAIILLACFQNLSAQESVQGVPADVFYLMPQMGQGTLLFRDKSPIPGKFNICAIDNTVRFLDKSGTELALEDDSSLVEVIIDKVPFLLRDGTFYRLDIISGDVFLATKREVLIMNDAQTASYGMESNTTAVQSIDFIKGAGSVVINLSDLKETPYRVNESSALYHKGSILSLNKRNCIKCFPARKADIEAWFKENRKIDSANPQAVLSLLKSWAE